MSCAQALGRRCNAQAMQPPLAAMDGALVESQARGRRGAETDLGSESHKLPKISETEHTGQHAE